MQHRFLKAAVLSVALFLCFSLGAQEIRSVKTLCELFPDGSADITQLWDATVVSGTEWYIPIGNLKNMSVSDLHVFEGDEEYISEGRNWNTSRSLEEKAGRCGIVDKGSDGVELCWGQGSYGPHEWLITYHVEGLVQSLKDCDAFNYMFVNPGLVAAPQYALLNIVNKTGGAEWTEDNVKFWGFGFEGESWLQENTIVFETDGRMKYEGSMIALVRFEKGLFSPSVSRNINFKKMQKKAFKGSSYSSGSGLSWLGRLDGESILVVLCFLLGGMVAIFMAIREAFLKLTGCIYKKEVFGETKFDGYFRDAPFGGSIPAAFYILSHGYRTMSHPKAEKGLVGAFLLKWIMEGRLRPLKDESGSNTKISLQIVEEESKEFPDSSESELYDMVRKASGSNLILEDKELEIWARINYKPFLSWKDNVDTAGAYAISDFRSSNGSSQEEARRVVEFRNFLNDFTLVAEREVPEVGLWKNYLIFALLFGLADKVSDAMKKLYPKDFEQFSNETVGVNTVYMSNLLYFSNNISGRAFEKASDAKIQADAKASSGGGGRTSFGGGGGFSGGGFGGGSR